MKTLDVVPSETKSVRHDLFKLSVVKGALSYANGARLRHLFNRAPAQGIPVQNALDPASVVVHWGDVILEENRDYRLDHRWGTLALAPDSLIGTDDQVFIDYSYSLLRLDSLVRLPDGREVMRKGESQLTTPLPPALAPGETRVANVLVSYNSDGKNLPLWPILETAEQAKTLSVPGKLPGAMAKIRTKEPLKIVCWGDSVTAGGESSAPELAFPQVFAKRLHEKFPGAPVEVKAVAVGGSGSRNWLYPDKFPWGTPDRQSELDWDRVARENPDVIVVEFVNDAALEGAEFEKVYGEILTRTRALGAELILITPHFTQWQPADFDSSRQPESRPYVLALRSFAEKHDLAVADASARWEHLWREGLPYVTLLRNAINHPDDRGHAIFADELIKCFG